MAELLGALQTENEQLKALLLSARVENKELRATLGKVQQEHEAVVVRLTAELLARRHWAVECADSRWSRGLVPI